MDGFRRWLPQYLPTRRWFGAKGRSIVQCEVTDLIDLDRDAGAVLAICQVTYASGSPDLYAVDVIAKGSQVEAAVDEQTVSLICRGFEAGVSLPSRRGGRLHYEDASERARSSAGTSPQISLLRGEQSNTSARVGQSLIFKLFRRLEPGENPDVEVVRFLTSARFRKIPSLEGSMTYEAPTGVRYTLGLLQAWRENAGDGWTYVVEALRQKRFDEVRRELAALGTTTAELHTALASDPETEAFRPEPASETDLASWSAGLQRQISRTIALLNQRASSLAGELRPLAERLTSRAAQGIDVPLIDRVFLEKIRIHGDYHLGQTLKTASGFVVIDFEGEPAKSLVERRQKSCALKDVAGMLRSFDYAMETAAVSGVDLRSAFLDCYLDTAASARAGWMPSDPRAVAPLLETFELEKAFYELEYELNNRPDWVSIPLRGILAVLSSSPL